MKKPKKRIKKPPYEALVVDYGRHRAVLPYRASVGNYTDAELEKIRVWCTKMFKFDTWRIAAINWPGYVYFEHERDLTMFLLVWSNCGD